MFLTPKLTVIFMPSINTLFEMSFMRLKTLTLQTLLVLLLTFANTAHSTDLTLYHGCKLQEGQNFFSNPAVPGTGVFLCKHGINRMSILLAAAVARGVARTPAMLYHSAVTVLNEIQEFATDPMRWLIFAPAAYPRTRQMAKRIRNAMIIGHISAHDFNIAFDEDMVEINPNPGGGMRYS